MHKKHPSSTAWRTGAILWSILMLLLLGRLLPDTGNRAAVTSQSVCVTVTVIGLDGGDPGTGDCEAVAVADSSSSVSSSESSSLSSSSDSSSSSTISQAVSAASVTSTRPASNGARRGTVSRSRSRMLALIRAWQRQRQHTAAPDVNWYDDAVRFLRNRGYIDAGNMRLDEGATRAETAKLVITLSGAVMNLPVTSVNFEDVNVNMWFHNPIERAAQAGLMLGYDNCFGSRPCYFRPTATITRAEAAVVIIRLLKLEPSYSAPVFSDVPVYAWYVDTIQTAADYCILQGDGENVRPEDWVNRAELMVMVYRAFQKQHYGIDCGPTVHAAAPAEWKDIDVSYSLDIPFLVHSAADDYLCSTGVMMCVLSAISSDINTYLVQPLLGSLIFPSREQLQTVNASEPAGWILSVFIISALACLISYRYFHRVGGYTAIKNHSVKP